MKEQLFVLLAKTIKQKHSEGKYVPKELEDQCINMLKKYISDKD